MVSHWKEWCWSCLPWAGNLILLSEVTQRPSSIPSSGTECVPVQRWPSLGVVCHSGLVASCPVIARGDAWPDFTAPGPDSPSPPAGEQGNHWLAGWAAHYTKSRDRTPLGAWGGLNWPGISVLKGV